MRIIIDGDSCPVIDEVFEAGTITGTEVVTFCTYAHYCPDRENVVLVDSEFQRVDMVIANELYRGDILITDDIGLGAIAIGKGAVVLSSRGTVYHEDNIDHALFQRFLSAKARRAGRKTKGPSKLLADDRKRFQEALLKQLGRS